MYHSLRNAIRKAYGDEPIPKKKKIGYHNATTPDQLIAARIVQSIAKDYPDWVYTVGDGNWKCSTIWQKYFRLHNRKFGVIIDWRCETRSPSNVGVEHTAEISVNDVNIDLDCGKAILHAYVEVHEKAKRAEKVAALALKQMKIEEQKWDLAEQVLGIKRPKKEENNAQNHD